MHSDEEIEILEICIIANIDDGIHLYQVVIPYIL